MYASPSIEPLLNVDPEKILGKPFLLYIRADDLSTFVEQVDTAKSSNVITHMRFWFQSPNLAEEIPCEAMIFGSSDGIVAVLRRCKPFMRKRLIQDSSGLYEFRAGKRRAEQGFGISTSVPNASWTTGSGGAARRTTTTRTASSRHGPYNHINYSSSADDHLSTSTSTNSTSCSPPSRRPGPPTQAAVEGTRKINCPLTRLHQGSINCIRNLDQEAIRPMTSVAGSEDMDGIADVEDDISDSERLLRRIHLEEYVGDDDSSTSSRDL